MEFRGKSFKYAHRPIQLYQHLNQNRKDRSVLCRASAMKSPYWLPALWEERLTGRPLWFCKGVGMVDDFWPPIILRESSRSKTQKHIYHACYCGWLVGFLTSSSTTGLYRGLASRLTSDNYKCCHT